MNLEMKRNRFFNPRLYVDGLKQLRLIGIMAFVILELEAIIVPMSQYISLMQYQEQGMLRSLGTLNFMEMHPLLCLCFLLFVPIMVLYLFSFLNKRSSSDFYHALPCSRVCLYNSFMAAVMTWITGVILVTSVTSLIGYTMLSQYCTINMASVWTMMFNMFAASLYVAAAVSLAMCLSGTLFTNLVVSFLLIFMPRILITIFTTYLSNYLYILSPQHFMPPLDGKYNVATNLVIGIITGNPTATFSYLPGGIYTLCLGLIFAGLAALAFHRRKSEAAGQSAPNRALQGLYRVLLGLIVCLIPCIAITNAILQGTYVTGSDIFQYIVLYIAAILVCLIYELITTRKWRNLLRTLPSLGILAALNVAIIGGLVGGYHSVLSFHPDEEDISYVRLADSGNSYFGTRIEGIKLDDPEICGIIANRLREQTDRIRKYPSTTYYQRGELQTVAIYTRGRAVYRRLPLSSADSRTIAGRLEENDEVRRIYTTLPKLGENATSLRVSGLTNEQAAALYDSFNREMAAKEFEDWYAYVQKYVQRDSYMYGSYNDSYAYDIAIASSFSTGSINVSTSIGTNEYELYLPLTADFPETANLYMQYINGGDPLERLRQLPNRRWNTRESMVVTVSGVKGLENVRFEWSGSELPLMKSQLNEFLSVLESADGQPDIRGRVLQIELNLIADDNFSVKWSKLYIPYPEDAELPSMFADYLERMGMVDYGYPTAEG